MAVAFAWFFVLVVVGVSIYYGGEMYFTPTRKLRRDFRRLRRSILRRLDRAERRDVRTLLDDCYAHLDAMCRAQWEHETIAEMIQTTEGLSGVKAVEARQRVNAFRATLATRLAETFAVMSRLSMAADLDMADPVQALRDFSSSLERQRHELYALDPVAELAAVPTVKRAS